MDLEQRVSELENKVSKLEMAVRALSSQQTNKQAPPYVANPKPVQARAVTTPPVRPTAVAMETKPNVAASQVTQRVQQQPRPMTVPPKKQSDMESFIGKNVFVLIASVLVFIGVVIFAGVVLPYLSDELKFILMCVASLGFTGFSYWFVRKKVNTLSISLLACGLGTIYITLFTGNLYFKVINTVLLYIALLLWIMVIYYCSRYKTFVFNVIGQAGILISLVLCMSDAIAKQRGDFVFYALIYVAVAEILYDILFREKGYMINVISMLTSVMILSYPIIYELEEDYGNSFLPFDVNKITLSDMFTSFNGKLISFLILLGLFGYAIVKNVFLTRQKKLTVTKYAIVNFVGLFVFLVSASHFEFTKGLGIVMSLYCLIILCITEWLYYAEDRDVTINILESILIGLVVIFYYSIFDTLWISGLILLIPLMLYIYKTNTKCSRVLVIVGLGLTTLANIFYANSGDGDFVVSSTKDITDWEYLADATKEAVIQGSSIVYYITCAVFSVVCYLLLIHRKNETRDYVKVLAYLFIVGNVFLTFWGMSDYGSYRYDVQLLENVEQIRELMIMLIALGIQFIFRQNKLFDKTKRLFQQSTFIAYFVVNAFMMLLSIVYLYDLDDYKFEYFIGVIITVILFTLNSAILLDHKDTGLAIYVGIKITILIFIVMHVFDLQPLVSIFLFLWAVACIILGLKNTQKYLRIYALILAMISAFKLVMFDISYSNMLARAGSFIVCAALCFFISWIYHRIEKSNAKQVEEQTVNGINQPTTPNNNNQQQTF